MDNTFSLLLELNNYLKFKQCKLKFTIDFLLFTVMYLNYGPFSSYGPQYDSTFANMSKEESDLLLSTYADETGVQYSKRSFLFSIV